MLFMVQMDVKVPHDFDAAEFAQLKAAEKIRAEELQRSGQYANVSIFEVDDTTELHDIMMSLPLFPFMTIEVTALCRHPSAITEK